MHVINLLFLRAGISVQEEFARTRGIVFYVTREGRIVKIGRFLVINLKYVRPHIKLHGKLIVKEHLSVERE